MIYYSKTTNAFYDSSIHGDGIPSDATDESTWTLTHQELLDGQASGRVISSDATGNPILIDQPAPTEEQQAASARSRRNMLLKETDYLLMPDYRITAEKLVLVKVYRQALRDITIQVGFPR